MAEAKINLSGGPGVIALVAVVIFFVVQVLSPSKSTDEQLTEAVRTHLSYKLSDYNMNKIAEMQKSGDYSDAESLLETANKENITIYSMTISKPVLSWGSLEKVIVKVEFSLPEAFDGGKKQTEYQRFRYTALDSRWSHKGRSSVISFYLNFL